MTSLSFYTFHSMRRIRLCNCLSGIMKCTGTWPLIQSAFTSGEQPFPEMNERDIDAARRVYGMVTNIDDNIGRLLLTLEQEQLLENTLVIFLTDNGPAAAPLCRGIARKKGERL